MIPEHAFNYDKEGVEIKIPALERKIGVRVETGKKLEDYVRGSGDSFFPQRLVIVFDLYDEENLSAEKGNLSQPATVRVRYTPQDTAAAGGRGNLRLGYYKDGHWRLFTKSEHKYTLVPDTSDLDSGYGVFHLNVWGDPPIGWGY